jgi:hypothetical protein
LGVTGNVDLNGGAIDGTVIGNSTAAAITGTTITGTSFVSSGDMTFGDDDKAIFGAGSDLQIYHDGTNSYISDQGTNDLKVLATDFQLKNSADNEFMMTAVTDGAVTLYLQQCCKTIHHLHRHRRNRRCRRRHTHNLWRRLYSRLNSRQGCRCWGYQHCGGLWYFNLKHHRLRKHGYGA